MNQGERQTTLHIKKVPLNTLSRQKNCKQKPQTLGERVHEEEEDAKKTEEIFLFSVSFLLNPSEEREPRFSFDWTPLKMPWTAH